MLWYLANGSLNDYLKSQVELQGSYYTGQKTHVAQADFSSNTNIATFNQINLENKHNFQSLYLLTIDEAIVELSSNQDQHSLTKIKEIHIKTLTLNIETTSDELDNVDSLMQTIRLKLANDYPELYPAISAKIFAKNNPELNADEYVKNHQQTVIIEHKSEQKTRGKPRQKLSIDTIKIKTLLVNSKTGNNLNSTQQHDIEIKSIGGKQGFEANQIGGEILLQLLGLKNQ